MATATREIRLHPAQLRFHRSEALYRGFTGGRGAGKSWIGAFDLIARSRPGRLYLVAAPTYTTLADVSYRAFISIARDLGVLDESSVKRSPPQCRLLTGAEVIFRSADNPERLRGPNLTGAWLDEASLMDQDAYDIVIAALREGGERGWLSTTFTPKGLTHWTYEVFATNRPDTELVRARTADNPFLDDAFASTISKQYSSRLALQELEGQFIAMDGAEWPGEYFGPHLWFDEWPSDCFLSAMALDPSKGKSDKHGDYSAFTLARLAPGAKLFTDAVLGRMSPDQIVDTAVDLYQQWKPDVFVVEANQFQELLGLWIIRRGRKMGFPIPVMPIVNTINKIVRVRQLGSYLSQQSIRFKAGSPGARLVVEQLRDFPLAPHDDGPDSLNMCVRALGQLYEGRQAKPLAKRIRT